MGTTSSTGGGGGDAEGNRATAVENSGWEWLLRDSLWDFHLDGACFLLLMSKQAICDCSLTALHGAHRCACRKQLAEQTRNSAPKDRATPGRTLQPDDERLDGRHIDDRNTRPLPDIIRARS